jgi:hypothetical protein
MRIAKMVQAAVLVSSFLPAARVAAFGMGGGSVVGVGVGMSMSNAAGMANGGNASYAHGSPAATNPAVAMMEARQRDAQVAAEIGQARSAGKNVRVAEGDWRRGEGAIESNRADEAMVHFNEAEHDIGIVANGAAMGSYSKSVLGSVTSGGTELSGAIVH